VGEGTHTHPPHPASPSAPREDDGSNDFPRHAQLQRVGRRQGLPRLQQDLPRVTSGSTPTPACRSPHPAALGARRPRPLWGPAHGLQPLLLRLAGQRDACRRRSATRGRTRRAWPGAPGPSPDFEGLCRAGDRPTTATSPRSPTTRCCWTPAPTAWAAAGGGGPWQRRRRAAWTWGPRSRPPRAPRRTALAMAPGLPCRACSWRGGPSPGWPSHCKAALSWSEQYVTER